LTILSKVVPSIERLLRLQARKVCPYLPVACVKCVRRNRV